MGSLLVSEVMMRDYPRIDKDDSLERALEVMEDYDLDRVVVFDEGRLVGVMTKKDIMMKLAKLRTRLWSTGRLHVSNFMTPNPKTISASEPLAKAAIVMAEEDIGSLPVVSGEDVVGLVTRLEASFVLRDRSDIRALDVMRTLPEALKETHKVLHARQLLLRYDTPFLPVVDEAGRPVGYVTIDIIADAFIAFYKRVPEKYRKERIEHLLVADIMRLRPPSVAPDTPLPEVIRVIGERRSKGVIVLHNNRIVGIITLHDLVRYAARLAQSHGEV